MKKILLTLVVAIFCSVMAMADDMPIDYKEVPANAKTFVTKYFPSSKVTAATKDTEFLGGTEYTVYLDNGTKIDFNSKGVWTEVECGVTAVPAGIVPVKIANYVKTKYEGSDIVKIDVDKTDYEIRLSNGLEMKFNLNGDFIKIDD